MEYQTDLQIKKETDALLMECLAWAIANYGEIAVRTEVFECEGRKSPEKIKLSTEDIRAIGITRFLYLKDKVLNHSPKYYRQKECKTGKGGTYHIEEADSTDSGVPKGG